jgi:hypothetical protein
MFARWLEDYVERASPTALRVTEDATGQAIAINQVEYPDIGDLTKFLRMHLNLNFGKRIRACIRAVYLDSYYEGKSDPFNVIILNLIPLGPQRVEVSAWCMWQEVQDFFQELVREIELRWPQAAKAPVSVPASEEAVVLQEASENGVDQIDRLQEPRPGATLDELFDWLHACNRAGDRKTLRDVAVRSIYEYSTVKKKHPEYMRRRGFELEGRIWVRQGTGAQNVQSEGIQRET